ncbi:unnamed protein product [Lepeophtheirus salmonis]|uniref:(salmon louse) hypothetical protein n=1 Tax=Lepeophtheirus salmonis TaxID=72036 RepID=A0A7R8CZ04_LEPSM|nr:unnamed protein product [Lepeophtheirus salmonis]CAF2972696.1 unnamed protein product [Lepeophtheirus salmonis]
MWVSSKEFRFYDRWSYGTLYQRLRAVSDVHRTSRGKPTSTVRYKWRSQGPPMNKWQAYINQKNRTAMLRPVDRSATKQIFKINERRKIEQQRKENEIRMFEEQKFIIENTPSMTRMRTMT